MGGTYTMSYTPSTGDTITAARWITAHAEHIAGNDFVGLGDYSASNSEMQSTTDPYPAGVESLATSGVGELERIRYQIKTQFGLSQWYHDVTVAYETFLINIASYRRPNLVYVSATQLDVENNTGTSNETKILFPDGTSRSVTEDTSSTHKYRRFDITADAEFTSGTEDSGLRAALSEVANTRYAIYAVKSTIDTSNFVLVGDTTFPIQANFATLNTAYGTNGWVFLGYIINGNGQSGSTDIMSFKQAGPIMFFNNSVSGSVGITNAGVEYATTSGATTLTYTYAAGSANAQVPNTITHILWQSNYAAVAGSAGIKDSGAARLYRQVHANNAVHADQIWVIASEGLQLSNGPGSSIAYDIDMLGYYNGALSSGTNPLL